VTNRHRRLSAVGAVPWLLVLAASGVSAANPLVPPPGPPYPEPEKDRAIYDYALILSHAAEVQAETVIDNIETRTGAEVVVYTQAEDYEGIGEEEADDRAIALIDQWHIGRAGFDDGLVIFLDMEPNLVHGQARLYAAPGFEEAYLTNSERQAIFDNDMLPRLLNADFDGALAVALDKVDAAATPDHAEQLQTARESTPFLGLSARRSRSWSLPDGQSSTGVATAKIPSTSMIRRSICRRRRGASPQHRGQWSWTARRRAVPSQLRCSIWPVGD
jgi:uncharacterized membrane protein YgcG